NIRYGINGTGHVSIKIYNELGQAVRTLVNETRSSGKYSAIWDGKNNQGSELPSGIYFCRIVASGQQKTIRLLFLK
ncbi:T9SS type A sorting domain-containing protein, partial [bacterium]|nr:T9SS type A sorting domain-containing protein [bacterium]